MSSLITAIVPVAETHRFLLPRALYSLSQQTYPPEILVVNDAPKRLDLDLPTVETGGGKGSAYARNLALDNVKTPLTFFLDADDYLLDGALELMLRAYSEYETCYIYSDWYQYNEHGYSYHKAKNYNRQRQLRHSIHLVSILLATDVAKSTYYDINYRGWEDWEFHIRLGQKGYCGSRLPEPLLIYDMTTSINREKHNAMAEAVYTEILGKYEPYLADGGKEFMACTTCGGDKPRIQSIINALPPEPTEGMVTLEYTGQNTAAIPFAVGRNRYRGANDDSNKFIQVPPEDVNALLNFGVWRKVPRNVKPIEVPQPEAFNEWRQMQPKVEIPQSWEKLFQQNSLDKPTDPVEKKPHRGRVKGTKNKPKPTVEASIEAVLTEASAR